MVVRRTTVDPVDTQSTKPWSSSAMTRPASTPTSRPSRRWQRRTAVWPTEKRTRRPPSSHTGQTVTALPN